MVSVASGSTTPISVSEGSPSKENQERINGFESSSMSSYNGRQRHKAHDPARDISIQVLEKFSLVTKFARETTSQIFGDSHNHSLSAFEKIFDNQPAYDHSNDTSDDALQVSNEVRVAPDPLEVILFVLAICGSINASCVFLWLLCFPFSFFFSLFF